jgi:hypothetical protein
LTAQLLFAGDDEDFELLKERNYETLLDYDIPDTVPSYVKLARQREEEEMAKINFQNCWMRMKEEEERLTALESGITPPSRIEESQEEDDENEEAPRPTKSQQ